MSAINTDLAVQYPWIVAKNGDNAFTITFTNNSAAFDITNYTFSLVIRRIGSSSSVLTLTQGSGITNGTTTGVLSIALTQAQASNLSGSYFYELLYTVAAKQYRLLEGTASLVDQYNPLGTSSTSLSISVTLGVTNLNAAITLAGGSGGGTAATTTFTPAGNISSTNVQTAIQELDSEKQAALGYTPENVANKDIDGTLSANSDTKYPSQKAVKTYADTKQSALGYTPENAANKGATNGYAPLVSGKVPSAYIPEIHFKGKYTSLSALQTAYPTASDGDYGIVDTGAGVNAKEYIWDAQDGWVLSSATGGVTSFNSRTGTVTSQNGDYTTDQVTEGTNQYFTNARALSATASAYLAPANNLSDVQTPGTALKNIGGTVVSVITVTDADYTLTPTDFAGTVRLIIMTSSAAHTFTVPTGIGLTGGEYIYVQRAGTGTVTFVQGSGQTVTPTKGDLTDAGQNVYNLLHYLGSSTWSLQNSLPNPNAKANGTTKGVAAFVASDFNDDGNGLISLDYTTAQAADSTHKGYLTSADWSSFNSKLTDDATILAYQALGSTVKAETVGLHLAESNTAFALGTNSPRWTAVYLTKAATLTGVMYYQRVTGSYTANNNNRVGLYSINSSTGAATLVASSTNNGALWSTAATNSLLTIPFTSTYVATAGLYFVVALYSRSAETTQPVLASGTGLNSSGLGSLDFTSSLTLHASGGGTTDLPASGTLFSALTKQTATVWCALY
jgi:hypothetical protein